VRPTSCAVPTPSSHVQRADRLDSPSCAPSREASYPYRLLHLSLPAAAESASASTATVKLALRLPSVLSFDSLLASPALSSAPEPLLALVRVLQTGSLADYRQWSAANAGTLAELDGAALEKKVRLLTLVGLCASMEQSAVPYAEIAKALEVEESEVEVWVIDGAAFFNLLCRARPRLVACLSCALPSCGR
jgi:translation initiation factor 3 subunit M